MSCKQWAAGSSYRYSWSHNYMLPSAVSKARMYPSSHGFCSIDTRTWVISHYCKWQSNSIEKSVPDATTSQNRLWLPEMMLLNFGALCLKECQHGGMGVSRCYVWDLLLWEIKAADRHQPATGVCYKDDCRAFQGWWILEENHSSECQLAVSNHTTAPPYAGCACPAWKVKAKRLPTGWPLGQQWDRTSVSKQLSEFCVLDVRVPLPLHFLYSDSNCSLRNLKPKTLPWSFSVFLFFVAFRPCGCSRCADNLKLKAPTCVLCL